MGQKGFLSDILGRVAGSRFNRAPQETGDVDLIGMCGDLLHDLGEASGLVTANTILQHYAGLSTAEKSAFFQAVCATFDVDSARLQAAIDGWTPGNVNAARKIHFAAEPKSQDLIRYLNRVPGATAQLVAMRADLLDIMGRDDQLRGLDQDFQHLFASWFNRGFLELRRIDWSTPAEILEKIIAYEAVHAISGWDDLRLRVGAPDRRLFAFFHPAMPSEPLIFVEVALTQSVPGAILPILSGDRHWIDPDLANTAVFYSISNCQEGLRGISFGNFLIKQVVVELQRDLPDLTNFVTLSPVPALRDWAIKAVETQDPLLSKEDRAVIEALDDGTAPTPDFVSRLAARYLIRAKRDTGATFDPVAHFHLGNGAELYKIHAQADLSPRGARNSWGVMVNYLYDGSQIETRHQAYSTEYRIAATSEVRTLAKF